MEVDDPAVFNQAAKGIAYFTIVVLIVYILYLIIVIGGVRRCFRVFMKIPDGYWSTSIVWLLDIAACVIYIIVMVYFTDNYPSFQSLVPVQWELAVILAFVSADVLFYFKTTARGVFTATCVAADQTPEVCPCFIKTNRCCLRCFTPKTGAASICSKTIWVWTIVTVLWLVTYAVLVAEQQQGNVGNDFLGLYMVSVWLLFLTFLVFLFYTAMFPTLLVLVSAKQAQNRSGLTEVVQPSGFQFVIIIAFGLYLACIYQNQVNNVQSAYLYYRPILVDIAICMRIFVWYVQTLTTQWMQSGDFKEDEKKDEKLKRQIENATEIISNIAIVGLNRSLLSDPRFSEASIKAFPEAFRALQLDVNMLRMARVPRIPIEANPSTPATFIQMDVERSAPNTRTTSLTSPLVQQYAETVRQNARNAAIQYLEKEYKERPELKDAVLLTVLSSELNWYSIKMGQLPPERMYERTVVSKVGSSIVSSGRQNVGTTKLLQAAQARNASSQTSINRNTRTESVARSTRLLTNQLTELIGRIYELEGNMAMITKWSASAVPTVETRMGMESLKEYVLFYAKVIEKSPPKLPSMFEEIEKRQLAVLQALSGRNPENVKILETIRDQLLDEIKDQNTPLVIHSRSFTDYVESELGPVRGGSVEMMEMPRTTPTIQEEIVRDEAGPLEPVDPLTVENPNLEEEEILYGVGGSAAHNANPLHVPGSHISYQQDGLGNVRTVYVPGIMPVEPANMNEVYIAEFKKEKGYNPPSIHEQEALKQAAIEKRKKSPSTNPLSYQTWENILTKEEIQAVLASYKKDEEFKEQYGYSRREMTKMMTPQEPNSATARTGSMAISRAGKSESSTLLGDRTNRNQFKTLDQMAEMTFNAI